MQTGKVRLRESAEAILDTAPDHGVLHIKRTGKDVRVERKKGPLDIFRKIFAHWGWFGYGRKGVDDVLGRLRKGDVNAEQAGEINTLRTLICSPPEESGGTLGEALSRFKFEGDWPLEILKPGYETLRHAVRYFVAKNKALSGSRESLGSIENHVRLFYKASREAAPTTALTLSELSMFEGKSRCRVAGLKAEDFRMVVDLCGEHLKEIDVSKYLFSDADFKGLSNCDRITKLTVRDNPNITGSFLAQFTKLETLDVTGSKNIEPKYLELLKNRNVRITGSLRITG